MIHACLCPPFFRCFIWQTFSQYLMPLHWLHEFSLAPFQPTLFARLIEVIRASASTAHKRGVPSRDPSFATYLASSTSTASSLASWCILETARTPYLSLTCAFQRKSTGFRVVEGRLFFRMHHRPPPLHLPLLCLHPAEAGRRALRLFLV